MDKNFRVRVSVGVGMFAIAIIGLYTFNSVPFKIIYGLFSFISFLELMSFFKKKSEPTNIILAVLETAFLIGGVLFVTNINVHYFWYIILGVPGYDIFAYLFGKLCGGKLIKNSRPFPKISKNKTWEGTILGLSMAIGMVAIKMAVNGDFATDYMYLFCGPLALIGDLFESFMKRKFEIKDSNEIVIKNKSFTWLEMLVGGSEGHGGFLDRIDSTAFSATILLFVSLLISIL